MNKKIKKHGQWMKILCSKNKKWKKGKRKHHHMDSKKNPHAKILAFNINYVRLRYSHTGVGCRNVSKCHMHLIPSSHTLDTMQWKAHAWQQTVSRKQYRTRRNWDSQESETTHIPRSQQKYSWWRSLLGLTTWFDLNGRKKISYKHTKGFMYFHRLDIMCTNFYLPWCWSW